MKAKLLICLLALAVTAWAASESKPAPTMPSEITLTSGRVLRNVQVVRWEKDRVVLKHSAGANTIAFSLIKSLSQEEIDEIRVVEQRQRAKVEAPKARRVGGQVFVTTRGAGGYKFAGARIAVLPMAALNGLKAEAEHAAEKEAGKLSRYSTRDEELEVTRAKGRYFSWLAAVEKMQPLASTTTDADGFYELTITATEPVFIFCATQRMAGLGEWNVWALPLTEGDRLDLNNRNML